MSSSCYMSSAARAWLERTCVVARDIRRDDNAGLYKMLYASNHPAGGNIAGWSANRPSETDQDSLF